MTEIRHSVNKSFGTVHSSSSSSFVGISTDMEIDSADLDGNTEYLLISHMIVGGASTSQNDFVFRTAASGSDLGKSYHRTEPRQSSSGNGQGYFWIDRYTTPATPVTIRQEFAHLAGTTNAYAGSGGLIALCLDDLTEDTDFFWDEDNTLYQNISRDNWTSGVSVTIGDGSSDYLILVCAHWLINNATSASPEMRLNVGGSSREEWQHEGEDTAEEFTVGFMGVVTAPAASTDVTLEYSMAGTGTGGNDLDRMAIIAIRLDAFEDHFAGRVTTTESMTVVDTWYDGGSSISHTTNTAAARDWLQFGHAFVDVNENNKRLHRRLRDTTRNISKAVDTSFWQAPNETTDFVSLFSIDEDLAIADNTAMTWFMQAQEETDVSPAPIVEEKNVAGFTFELVTAPCDQDIIPDSIVASTYLSGAITDIDEGVDTPDANWLELNAP